MSAVFRSALAAERTAGRDEDKILGIELLRFSSALAVLIFHYQIFAFQGTAQPGFIRTAQPFYPLLQFFYNYGFWGVQVFWCISGFIFFWKYGPRIAQGNTGGYKFSVLRFSRLYPLHLMTLLFMAGMQALYYSHNGSYFVYQNNDAYHFVLQLFMASNWRARTGYSFNGPIWSISLEVLVYAFFFVSLRYVSSSALFIVLVALAAIFVQRGISSYLFFSCLMYFYLGCLTAVVYERQRRSRWIGWTASAGAIVTLLTLVAMSSLITVEPRNFMIMFAPILIFLCVKHIRGHTWISRLLVSAGNMTYSSYLLHVPIQITVACFCTYLGVRIPLYDPAFFLAFMATTLWLSYWCYRLFEMPAQAALRKRLLRAPALSKSRSPTPS